MSVFKSIFYPVKVKLHNNYTATEIAQCICSFFKMVKLWGWDRVIYHDKIHATNIWIINGLAIGLLEKSCRYRNIPRCFSSLFLLYC